MKSISVSTLNVFGNDGWYDVRSLNRSIASTGNFAVLTINGCDTAKITDGKCYLANVSATVAF